MRIPKKYGQSRIEKCPFCDKQGSTTNSQGFPVCSKHKDALMGPMKCVCGQTVDPMTGKYGVFFLCSECGPQNCRKIFEFNTIVDVSEKKGESKEKKPFPDTTGWAKSRAKPVQSRSPNSSKPIFNFQKKTGEITKKKHVPKEIEITTDDEFYFS